LFRVPEQYRVKSGPYGSNASIGNCGAFFIPHPTDHRFAFWCLVSDGIGMAGWEHVSVSVRRVKDVTKTERTPTWSEMCTIKAIFWEEEDVVVQYHPAKSAYVNDHPHCLHLFRPLGVRLPEPPPQLVGFGGK
jgi:hypothetical protein